MKGLIVADIQARTLAMMWIAGKATSSSTTLTSIRGRKHTRKEMKMVSIILVSRRSWTE